MTASWPDGWHSMTAVRMSFNASVTRAQLAIYELRCIVAYEKQLVIRKERRKSGGYWNRTEAAECFVGVFVEPRMSSFTEDMISKGWVELSEDQVPRTTGLGRCIHELHRAWDGRP